jgi:hypothetical protein
MKKIILSLLIVSFLICSIGLVMAKKDSCVTIQSKNLLTSDGRVITPGYDEWGYNYQARMFNGGYCDAYRDASWCQDYKEDNLIMKWNDAWLDNKDCNDDGLLDRYYGFESYIGSGAWLTNHMSGEYEQNEELCKWTYFTKIVAAPEDAVAVDGVWYSAEGIEIGPVIWGAFATIQEISNDPCAEEHGIIYNSPSPTGFGFYFP